MPKLSISSGAISMSDLRTHFLDTDSISMSDFRSGGNKVVSGLEAYSHVGSKYVNNSSEQTYWRVRTTQTATGTNGSGTVTTSAVQWVHVGGTSGEQGSFAGSGEGSFWTNTGDYGNIGKRGKYPIGNPQGYVKRGDLVSSGSYSAWQDNLGFKDIFENSTRSKSDYYKIVFEEPNSRIQVLSNVNNGVPLSGSIGFDDLYEVDNGIIWSGTINAGDSGSGTFGRGFSAIGSFPYGSVATSANVSNIDDILQGQGAMTLAGVSQQYGASTTPIKVEIRGVLRTTAAGSISNTSTSNISRSRFNAAFNHTGFGYTDTTAVWTRPDDLLGYHNYDYRNKNWSSNSANTTRRDDGHSGWLLPTQGPTLLQVRGESEGGSPFLNGVRFTPNSSWQGKTVAIQALRTRNAGGISNFSCSGAASGSFSGLGNTNGGPITRYIKLPSSGYITLSANSTGSYSGTNRIIQISVFDPFQWGMAKDRLVIRQVYVNGSLVGDVTTDGYNSIATTDNVNNTVGMVNGVKFLDTGVTLPSSGTFTVEIRR